MKVEDFLGRGWQKMDEITWHERQKYRAGVLEASARAGVSCEERVLAEIARSEKEGWDTAEQGFLQKGDLLFEAWAAMRASEDPEAFFGQIEATLAPQGGPEDVYCLTGLRWGDMLGRVGRDEEAETWIGAALGNAAQVNVNNRMQVLNEIDKLGVDGTQKLWTAFFGELPSYKICSLVKELLAAGHVERALLAVRSRDDLSAFDIKDCAQSMAAAGEVQAALDLMGQLDAADVLRAAQTLIKFGEPGVSHLLSILDDQPASFDRYNAFKVLAEELDDASYAAKAVENFEAVDEGGYGADTLAGVARLCQRFDLPEFESTLTRFFETYEALDEEGRARYQTWATDSLCAMGPAVVERFLSMAADPEKLQERMEQLGATAEAEGEPDAGAAAATKLNTWSQPENPAPDDADPVDDVIVAATEDRQPEPAERARRKDLAVRVLCRLERLDEAEAMARKIAEEGKRTKGIRDFERGALMTVAAGFATQGDYAKAAKLLGEAEDVTDKFGLGEAKIYDGWLHTLEAVS